MSAAMRIATLGVIFCTLSTGLFAQKTKSLALAAHTLGYYTHYIASPSGPAIGGKAIVDSSCRTHIYDMSKYLKGKGYTKGIGTSVKTVAVEGNCQFITCIVIGKPSSSVDAVSAVTAHGRPKNWAIADK